MAQDDPKKKDPLAGVKASATRGVATAPPGPAAPVAPKSVKGSAKASAGPMTPSAVPAKKGESKAAFYTRQREFDQANAGRDDAVGNTARDELAKIRSKSARAAKAIPAESTRPGMGAARPVNVEDDPIANAPFMAEGALAGLAKGAARALYPQVGDGIRAVSNAGRVGRAALPAARGARVVGKATVSDAAKPALAAGRKALTTTGKAAEGTGKKALKPAPRQLNPGKATGPDYKLPKTSAAKPAKGGTTIIPATTRKTRKADSK